jgi:hypothetical protein
MAYVFKMVVSADETGKGQSAHVTRFRVPAMLRMFLFLSLVSVSVDLQITPVGPSPSHSDTESLSDLV